MNSGAMASVLDSFCIYHVTAPGQEPGAKDLPDGFVYPNMDELSEQVCFLWILYAIVGNNKQILIMVQKSTFMGVFTQL